MEKRTAGTAGTAETAGLVTRRGLLLSGLGVIGASRLFAQAVASDPAVPAVPPTGSGDIGTLQNPDAAGRPRARTIDGDNDKAIQQIELRIKCPCPCSLDVYTCRTTDFTCTYSPETHKEVLALYNEGKSAQQILDTFVQRYGEKALMAPEPKGFNLAGYVVPGTVLAVAGGLLVLLFRRRQLVAAPAAASAAPLPDVGASHEEMERLRRALAESDA